MKIVTYADADEDNNVYALCSCLLFGEGIEIPRPEHTEFICFDCPRCHNKLGIVALGKVEKEKGETLKSVNMTTFSD